MIADAIMDASVRGSIVLDPFAGSGSTVIAADRVDRRCFAIEIDARFVDLIVRRFEHVTGKKVLHANGRSFEHLARQRGVALVKPTTNNGGT